MMSSAMKTVNFLSKFLVFLLSITTLTNTSFAESDIAKKVITLASTTSTQNSGLFDHLLPIFEAEQGIKVNVVAVGTGAALKLARNGDADVLMVHHKKSEEKFVADGFGAERFDLMHNDFVLVGPAQDPANVSEANSISDALKAIGQSEAIFLSRGDDSGTHKKELELWSATNIKPTANSGKWYREAGAGMGATLNVAVAMNGYTLADRATWISFKNKQDHKIVFEGDKRLFNQYGIILVNKARHPHIKADEGQKFVSWMLSKDGQAAIASFKLQGEQLFVPDAISDYLAN
ncbi:MAG: substrate-binding domain-containing protein [Alphaproteobacteria bacterium]|nr:substrate-binding domain-containing protein [Alphaproteobacteria bacterium]